VPGVDLLLFVLTLVVVLGVIHLYLWQRLVRDTIGHRRWRRLAGFGLLAGLLLTMTTTLVEQELPRPLGALLIWLGYLWLGVVFYLLIALVLLELPVLVAWLVLRRRRAAARPALVPVPVGAAPETAPPPEPPVPDPSRRRLLRRSAAIAAGVAAVGISGYGVSRAYRPPRVTRLSVPLARLDPRADGLRVAVVADIHVSPVFGAGHVERVVEIVNSLNADLVTVVGDMVSAEVGQVRSAAAPLRGLRSRYGSYFVTGNHEYYNGYEEWIEAADDLGLRVLRNERVEIIHRGGVVDLAGVNDREGSAYDDPPDYRAALADRDPSRPVLLMAHQPVQVREAARFGVDLQLSGHTHGGQLYPFDYLVRIEQPVVSGLSEVDGTLVYVTNGAGFWGPPMRVGADPDVTLLQLRAP
jgi:predicted MPP superfamily phosphohydrolase